MKRSSFFVSSALVLSTLGVTACGGLADPTDTSGEHVATVSGALSGTDIPAGAHVALVWRSATGLYVGADAPVVNGHYTLSLTAPPDEFFSEIEGGLDGDSVDETPSGQPSSGSESDPGQGDSEGELPSPEPPSLPDAGGAGFRTVHLQDDVGGKVTGPLQGAIAGFIVYVDKNGNGKLDILDNVGTPDDVLGGNEDLLAVYLRAGGSLAYEKLRDNTGAKPVEGFNVLWEDRPLWISLTSVDLVIKENERLPGALCDGASSPSSDGDAPVTSEPQTMDGGARDGSIVGDGQCPVPAKGVPNPNLWCSDDGRTFYYSESIPEDANNEPSVDYPDLVCNVGYADLPPSLSCTLSGSLAPTDPVPANWPCEVTDAGNGK